MSYVVILLSFAVAIYAAFYLGARRGFHVGFDEGCASARELEWKLQAMRDADSGGRP